MSTLLKEKIVDNIPVTPASPATAFLVINEDGTHDRYVSDINGVVNKQRVGLDYKFLKDSDSTPIEGSILSQDLNTLVIKKLANNKVDFYITDENGKVFKLGKEFLSQDLSNLNDTGLRLLATLINTGVREHSLPKGSFNGTAEDLKQDINNLTQLLQVNDSTLGSLQQVVDYIKMHKATLDNLGVDDILGLETALNSKVDKVSGKSLSTNDFTTELKDKLVSINLEGLTSKGGYEGTSNDLYNLITNLQNLLNVSNPDYNTLEKIYSQLITLRNLINSKEDSSMVDTKISQYKPSVIKSVDNQEIKFKEITQSAYNALTTKDTNTYYLITQ